jgi:hypothetical protein
MRLVLSPFFDQVTDDEKLYWNFMQNNAMACTANNSMDSLGEFFSERVISQRFWPPKSHSLRPQEYYLRATLKK